ncbi:MAG: hypothetical protein ACRDAX_03950 [Propionibacteriaceae bacterium]
MVKLMSYKIAIAVTLSSAIAVGAPISSYASPSITITAKSDPVSQLEREIKLLESLSDADLRSVLERSIAANKASQTPSTNPGPMVAPVIIVWAIGCGVAGISSVATGAWSTSSGSAWAIAGILVGCIPGSSQASLVKTILSNKTIIARALRAVGLTAAAAGLLKGDTAHS